APEQFVEKTILFPLNGLGILVANQINIDYGFMIKSNMGNKALSHDSIFMLDPEIERSTGKMHFSLESHRGRSLQRSHVSRTLPRIGTSNVHGALSGAMFGVVPRYVPRSGVWVAGSKITEFKENFFSQELRNSSVDSFIFSHTFQNYSEASTGTGLSQSSTACASSNVTQQPVGFNIPATTQGCLDSSAARHKMALNPRKQKKKKSLQASVSPPRDLGINSCIRKDEFHLCRLSPGMVWCWDGKQDETSLSLISEGEKSTNNPKEIDQKKLNKDGTGTLKQDPSNKTEIYDQKIAEQASNTDPTGSMGYPMLAAYGRRRRRKGSCTLGTNEYGRRGRCLLPSCQLHILGDRYDYSHLEKTASDCPFRHLTLEKQTMEQFTTPQAESTTSQELFSDKGDLVKKNVGLEVKAKKASAPQPIPKDMVESMVSGPPLYHENGACGAKKQDGRASLSPMVGRLSKAQEEDILSVAVEAQVLRDPSHVQSGEEEASSHGLQNSQSKMELAQGVPTICKEKSPGNILQGFTVIIPGVASTVAEGSLSTERLSPRSLSQSLDKPEDEEVSSDSNSASEEGSVQEQRAPEHSFQSPQKLEGEQEGFPESESFVEMSGLEQNQGPEYSHKFLGKPQPEDASSESDSVLEEGKGPEEMAAIRFSRSLSQEKLALGKPQDQREQQVFSSSVSLSEGYSSSLEPVSPSCSFQPWRLKRSLIEQKLSLHSDITTREEVISMKVMPGCSSQPSVRPKVEKQLSLGADSAAVVGEVSMETLPPKLHSQSMRRPLIQQQVSASPRSTAVEGSISVDLRPPTHPFQTCTSIERSCPIPPRYTYQPWGNPQIEQQASTSPESVTIEGGSTRDTLLSNPHSRSVMKHTVQKGSPSFESATVEEGNSGRALPPEYPTQFSVRSKVQEMSSLLENPAGEEDFSKKPRLPSPSQTFVKFMAQQIFSESASIHGGMYADPLPLSHPFKSLLRPKMKHHVFSDWENAEGGTSLKKLPMKHPLQSVGRPEGPQDGLSYSENVPSKWSSSKGQVPTRQFSQVLGKFEYQQEVSSVSDDSPEEWRISEEHMPSRHPSQTLDGSEQPPILSPGSGNLPVDWSSPAEASFPVNPFQAYGNPGYQQQTHSSSTNVAGEGTIFENNPGNWSLSKCPVSPKKTKKFSQVSEDFIKSIPVSANKPGKFNITLPGKTPISGSAYIKEEVLHSGTGHNDGHTSILSSEAEVENLFGVRLRRIPSSQKLKNEKRDNLAQFSSVPLGPIAHSVGREQRMRRSNPQVFLSIPEDLSDIANFAEKQQNRNKLKSMLKRPPVYIPPGKPSDCAIAEAVWINMTKQRQRGSQAYVPEKELKPTSRTGAKDETKDPKYGGKSENLKHFISCYKNTPTSLGLLTGCDLFAMVPVAFEDQKTLRMSAIDKETKQSSSLPAGPKQPLEPVVPVEPDEPVWFSMAKKKAKAWSHIAEIMQ
uniref:DUF4592 domain-containing protein n=1 Tax=Spermophilus dauricus TaxID=99837 RepID=A0A8C9P1D6_SPEDA